MFFASRASSGLNSLRPNPLLKRVPVMTVGPLGGSLRSEVGVLMPHLDNIFQITPLRVRIILTLSPTGVNSEIVPIKR